MQKNIRTISYGLLSCFVLLLYYIFYSWCKVSNGMLLGRNFNLTSYVIMLFLICLFIGAILFFFTKRFFPHKQGGDKVTDKKIDYLLAGLIILCGMTFIFLIYLNENTIYPEGSANLYIRSQINKPLYSIFISVAFVTYVLLAKKYDIAIGNGRRIVGFLFAIICAFCAYSPNPFSDDVYHIHAYANSIINVANLNPFDNYNISIYGHYGLLYLPIVKLLGNDYSAIAISISLVSFVSYFLIFSLCEKWIKRDSVYLLTILAICAIPMMFYRNSQYYQIQPHRLLFPSVSLSFISQKINGDSTKKKILAYEIVIGILAVIWNLETGIVAIAVFCVFNFSNVLLKGYISKRQIVEQIIRDIALFLTSIIGAYLIINIYSFLVGSRQFMSISRFIYPLDNKSYRISDLRTSLCTPFCIYVIQLIVFSCVLLNSSLALFSKEASSDYKKARIILICIAISGFGSVVYFVNRVAYANIAISWVQMALTMGILGSEGMTEFRTNKNNGTYFSRIASKMILLFYVFIFAIEGSLGLEATIRKRLSTSWNTESIENFMDNEASTILELPDMLAFGVCVPELLFQIHRNDVQPIIDWSDMNNENQEKVYELLNEYINQKKPIFISDPNMAYNLESQGYVKNEYKVGNIQFYLLASPNV